MSEERQWSFTLHQCQIKGTEETSRKSGTERQGWQKREQERRVLILKPVLPLHITGRPFKGLENTMKDDEEKSVSTTED